MKTCETCKFWKARSVPAEWKWDDSVAMPKIGQCRSKMVCTSDDSDVSELYYSHDGSESDESYRQHGMPKRLAVYLTSDTEPAELGMFTVPSFGCVMHKERTRKAP